MHQLTTSFVTLFLNFFFQLSPLVVEQHEVVQEVIVRVHVLAAGEATGTEIERPRFVGIVEALHAREEYPQHEAFAPVAQGPGARDNVEERDGLVEAELPGAARIQLPEEMRVAHPHVALHLRKAKKLREAHDTVPVVVHLGDEVPRYLLHVLCSRV